MGGGAGRVRGLLCGGGWAGERAVGGGAGGVRGGCGGGAGGLGGGICKTLIIGPDPLSPSPPLPPSALAAPSRPTRSTPLSRPSCAGLCRAGKAPRDWG